MTKEDHIKTFGDTRFYNKKTDFPEGLTHFGELGSSTYLSEHPEDAIKYEKANLPIRECKLKPCPCCGGEAKSGVESYAVSKLQCIDCGLKLVGRYDADDWNELFTSWNKRVKD